ncbi:hypothetical protein [Stigmatella aurantiaca]|uniref:Conserved uncharacterized protein n=2 Tax=Stigmatella aurantiaca (strain DW4/3-1) TaxID=378806 RepID=E3FYT7_STIAD|nr:hypothetical protein [Stigmatella aurantiaca]ADO72400.1 conserved uncharacterized protein [Stigmatella aurantiaca DW4/3-1]
MKRYFGVIVLFVGVLVASVMFYRKLSAQTHEAERKADLARIQKEYLERAGWMRSNPDDKGYREEVVPFFKAYFEQIATHQNRYGGNKEFDTYLQEVERQVESGKEDRADDRKAFYQYTRKVFDTLRNGRYHPEWTATDKGMRLDVVSSDVVMVLGKPQVRLQLALWGAQRELKEDGKLKKMVTSASFDTAWRLTDARGKLLGEMRGTDPSMKIDFPERFIAEFPPQMVLGHYDMDLVPSEVSKMDITFKVASRAASGGIASATYTWKLDVPGEWRLGAGEKWEGATEEERPEEEIDPAKASAKQ